MRIEIDLPDWCDPRHIYIFAGIELAAYKPADATTFKVKDVRCNMCGKCCKMFNNSLHIFPLKNEGTTCDQLDDKENICMLGGYRPISCSMVDPILLGWDNAGEYCCVKYKV